jgi:tetratricopeptide (TPR) repeat protein
MASDPYELCPCGSGTKQKWCTAREGMKQLDQAIGMIKSNQREPSLQLLDRLMSNSSEPACFRAYAATIKAQALDVYGQPDKALETAEKAAKDFPESGMPREVMADIFYANQDYAEALGIYQEALSVFPAGATKQICRTLLKIGNCHNFQGRPLAAWASWQRALLVSPDFTPALESIDEFIHQNRLLPHPARLGLALKKADEFDLFNEEVADTWEKAAGEGEKLHVDDLIMLFDDLVSRDPANASAWYNLGLSCAWAGQNLRAMEALSKYVERETNIEAAADAWDLAEVLRMGAGAESLSDNLLYSALYQLENPEEFVQRLQQSKRLMVVATHDGHRTLHWMDKEVQTDGGAGVPIIGGPPRQLAQLNLVSGALEIVATRAESLAEVRRLFDPAMEGVVRFHAADSYPGSPTTLDSEPFLVFDDPKLPEEQRQQRTLAEVRRYFEEEWLHRPLKSLDNIAPIDAAQSSKMKGRLEGLVRFRERNFEVRGLAYNFDRLRNKLGLPIHGSGLEDEKDKTRASSDVDLSAYSASQLAALEPMKLDDDELVVAYRTAVQLDSPDVANRFADQLVRRDSASSKIDMNSVFRRLIQETLQGRLAGDLTEIIHRGREYDRRLYQARESAMFDYLEARSLLASGQKGEGTARLKNLADIHPDRLDVVASAVETLLSLGAYGDARELAEVGLSRSEENRQGDLQARFRDYVQEASARAKK